jgi:four helix bundle protein
MGNGFKRLTVWITAKALAVDVCRTTDSLRDFALRDQIRRSAVSVPSNIAEGDERGTDKDSVRFFYIAKGSLAELITQLEIASDIGLLAAEAKRSLTEQADTLAHQLGALIKARTNHGQPIAHRP